MYNLFTFHSTHSALLMEKTLVEANLTVKLIPVPRVISSSCGFSARTLVDEYSAVKSLIDEKEIEVDKLYTINNNGEINIMT